ncbi:hypothetical protein SAMN05444285_10591 [Draconibacterium orientale]|nr:hypothetical protein SAMN05444285_10591 [Draconibacterium orientale]
MTYDVEKISNDQNEIRLRANYIKSVAPRWLVGTFGGCFSQTYMNIKSQYNIDAGVEYDIFPRDFQ